MASEFKKKLFWRAVVAEFLAMILFVFISIGSALGFNYPVRNNQTAGAAQDNVKVSLAFGLSIATLAQSVGHISGAHLNPAVTLGLLLSCQISILRAVMYIIAQCVGAIVATAILSGITSSLPDNSLGRNELAPGVNSGQGLGIEIIGTLQLVLCVLATTDRRRRDLGGSGPLAIGLSVALGHLLAIDYTGCGINPARSFGSSVITHNFKDHWIFWVGPFIGGALAVLIYDFILAPRSSDLTDRVKVWTSGQVEEYELDGDDINSRVEMKPNVDPGHAHASVCWLSEAPSPRTDDHDADQPTEANVPCWTLSGGTWFLSPQLMLRGEEEQIPPLLLNSWLEACGAGG
uniref:Aquaporin-1 n=1 Tax=Canis lupus familiaris TaxID=9615 RepID=A0A8C0RFD9_CANLF